MAVTFNPHSGDSVTIGGSSTTGPFPKYSIGVERVESDAGVLIDIVYAITVTGQMIASGDVTSEGARQKSLFSRQKVLAALLEQDSPTGQLNIDPYGGSTGMRFGDAKLTGVEFPEGDDETGGTQVADYTFNFQASTRDSKIGTAQHLSACDESWEVAKGDEKTTDLGTGESQTLLANPKNTFTVTHTISATGFDKYVNGLFSRSGWDEARAWVQSRLKAAPTEVTSNLQGNATDFTNFDPKRMGNFVAATEGEDATPAVDSGLIDLTSLNSYDYNVQITSDINAGTYSATETYFLSPKDYTTSIEMSYEVDEEDVSTVTVNVSINGLDKPGDDDDDGTLRLSDSSIKQAIDQVASFKGLMYSEANTFYRSQIGASDDTDSETGALLDGRALSTTGSSSESRNYTTGEISLSQTYNDKNAGGDELINENNLSESHNFSDSNKGHTNNTVAILPVIGKPDGPVFQNMGTTNERKRSLSLEWTSKKNIDVTTVDGDGVSSTSSINFRKAITSYLKGDTEADNYAKGKTYVESAYTHADTYRPDGTQGTHYWQISRTDGWNEQTGQFTLSIEWTY